MYVLFLCVICSGALSLGGYSLRGTSADRYDKYKEDTYIPKEQGFAYTYPNT